MLIKKIKTLPQILPISSEFLLPSDTDHNAAP